MNTSKRNQQVLIIGGGPAGLMTASQLLDSDCEIHIIDQKPSIGRKFLVAGDGGFNLTHSEPLAAFLERYDTHWIRSCVARYPNTAFIAFLNQIGIPTTVGTSGKIFPEPHIKPIQVLNAWKAHLGDRVIYHMGWKLEDFEVGRAHFTADGIKQTLLYDYLVLCLGGRSWSVTGSDGAWENLLAAKQIQLVPFTASNSGLELYANWLPEIDGQIIKNVVVSANGYTCHGDIVCTRYGLEGKPIYAVNRGVRLQEKPTIIIDFKPQMSHEKIVQILRKSKTHTLGLKELKLPAVALFWLKTFVSKETFNDPNRLAEQIKSFKVAIKGFRPIEEVISTAGGVAISALDEFGEIVKLPQVFCAGEMIDWDAPTGGYLIQGCVSSGWTVGKRIAEKLLIDTR